MKSNTRTTRGETTCLSLNALRTLEEGDISRGFGGEGIVAEVENCIGGQKKREGAPSEGVAAGETLSRSPVEKVAAWKMRA